MQTPHSWMTFHRVRFSAPRQQGEFIAAKPQGATLGAFGPDSPLNESGQRSYVSRIWGGLALYETREAAAQVVENPTETLPWITEADEAWHALLCPISHRGTAHWFGTTDASTLIRPAPSDPGGATVVMTSAGFDIADAAQLDAELPRIRDFLANVERVRDWYASLSGNLALMIASPLGEMQNDGATFSIWKDDAAMLKAAYQPGLHRQQVDRYKSENTADRTSFTRARLLASAGTWDGVDPATEAVNAPLA